MTGACCSQASPLLAEPRLAPHSIVDPYNPNHAVYGIFADLQKVTWLEAPAHIVGIYYYVGHPWRVHSVHLGG